MQSLLFKRSKKNLLKWTLRVNIVGFIETLYLWVLSRYLGLWRSVIFMSLYPLHLDVKLANFGRWWGKERPGMGWQSDKTGWLNNSMSYFAVSPVLGMYHTGMCAYMLQKIYKLMCLVTLFKALIAARWRQAQSLSITE